MSDPLAASPPAVGGAATLPELLWARAAHTPDAQAVFHRQAGRWEGSSWREIRSATQRIAAGLARRGLRRGDRVAVMAPTSARWMVVEMAILCLGGVVVGVDPHAPPAEITHLLRRLDVRALVTDTPARLAEVPLPMLRASLGEGAADVSGWDDLLTSPALDAPGPAAGDPAMMLFTSGTTGVPRTIEYTHAQVLEALRAVRGALPELDATDRMIAWLPMANLFQRMVNLLAVSCGAATHFLDDPREILATIAEVEPTFFIGVPRFYEKLLASPEAPLLGGKLHYALTGSAPIAKGVLEALRDRGALVLEAYGLSENVVPMAMNRLSAHRFGSVGRPLECNEIRIAADGEVEVRGPGLFRGYHGEPGPGERFTADGFYRTGDLGRFDDDGFLHLLGRSTDMLKTSTGHRVSPSRVEAVYTGIPGVDRLVVVGEGRPYLVALVVPNPMEMAAVLSVDAALEPADLAASSAVRAHLLHEIELRASALAPHERVRRIAVLPEPFSVANGEVTPNQKLRRRALAERHSAVVDALYRQEGP